MIAINILFLFLVSFIATAYMILAREGEPGSRDHRLIQIICGILAFVLMVIAYLILLTIQTQVKGIL